MPSTRDRQRRVEKEEEKQRKGVGEGRTSEGNSAHGQTGGHTGYCNTYQDQVLIYRVQGAMFRGRLFAVRYARSWSKKEEGV